MPCISRGWANQDPFDATGEFAVFAKKLGLVAGKTPPPKATWKEFDSRDRRVEMVHRCLKLALRILGPNRYRVADALSRTYYGVAKPECVPNKD